MSGIFGIFHKDGEPIDAKMLQTMQEAMVEWGTDGSQLWCNSNVGLGCLYAQSVPEPYDQFSPLHHSANSLAITGDARIDNRQELCDQLQIPHPERQILSDSTLIGMAYRRWGIASPRYIVGAYAFAIWDQQTHHLFLARDHIGFRPLHIYDDSNRFIFATDIRAILAIGSVPQRLDSDAIAATRAYYTRYLLENTLYQDIKKLPPAHTLTASDNRVKRSVYWLPHEVTKVSLNSNDAYAEQLRDRLEEAVACRTRSPYPVGSHLSGGLDSSTVTVLATRKLRAVGRDLAGAFAWAPPPRPEDYPLQDERQFIEEICQHANLTCTHVPLTADDVIEMWQGDMSQKPQVTLYHELPTRRLAKAQGIRVMLSGWGGDEFATAHGRGYYSETLLRFRLITLLRELKEASTVRETSVKNVLRRDVIQPLLPNFLYKRQIMTQAREILDDPHIRDKTRAYFKRMLLETRVAPLVRTNLYKPFYHGWLTARIECWALHGIDHQIEYRYPLLDRRVIEFCLGLPADQFVQNGWQRFIFRNAMTGLLPKAICWTPRNKMFAAQYSAMHPTVMEARDRFVAGMQSGDFNITGVSSMWQDRRLPI